MSVKWPKGHTSGCGDHATSLAYSFSHTLSLSLPYSLALTPRVPPRSLLTPTLFLCTHSPAFLTQSLPSLAPITDPEAEETLQREPPGPPICPYDLPRQLRTARPYKQWDNEGTEADCLGLLLPKPFIHYLKTGRQNVPSPCFEMLGSETWLGNPFLLVSFPLPEQRV